MDFLEKIEKIIEPSLNDMGFEVVRIQFQGAKRKTLQIMIDTQDDRSVTIDDCAQVSYAISARLEVEDPIDDPYTLEVSSPGIDRPLVKLRDFQRYSGKVVQFELKYPLEGRRRFQGRLKGVRQDKILLDLDEEGEEREFDFDDIQKAKIKSETKDLKTNEEEKI